MIKKKINIVPYDYNWPKIFEIHAEELRKALKNNLAAIYHVGSTSVPGLCAKPKIDIMCVVKNLKGASKTLESLKYTYKGEFNLPLRLFFNRKSPNDINLHVVNEDSGEINWNLVFQNYLRNNSKARNEYANLKLKLIKENPQGFNLKKEKWLSEYTIKKGEFIIKLAKEAGFNDYRFLIASNKTEIKDYKEFLHLKAVEDVNSHIFNLCLYKGLNLKAAALLEINKNFSRARINKIKAINNKNEKTILLKINQWLNYKDIKLIN